MIDNKNIELAKHKQEILTGSSSLTSSNQKKYDRTTYMVKYMTHNKAYQHVLEKDTGVDANELLNTFRNKYENYRHNWHAQPKECISNLNFGPELLKAGHYPLCIDIETAAICDLACPFCFRESLATPDKIISIKLFKKIVDQAVDMGVPSIKLNWRGEPLMHPKLYQMIEYAKHKGILETIINTNATHLSPKISRRLIESGLDFMIYSFDGGTKETYEKMRPGRFKKNNFDHVYQNIVNFSNIREQMNAKFPSTKIQMILTEDSYTEQESFYSLFKDFVDEVTVTQYAERGGNIEDLNNTEKAQYADLCNQLSLPEGTPYMRDANGNISVSSSRLPCEQPYQRMLVTYDGRVAMCCNDWGAMHPIGYVADNSFFDEDADKRLILDRVKEKKRGFELMQEVSLPPKFNKPVKKVETLSQIWTGKEVEKVRCAHGTGNVEEVNICKKCTFKDTYNWVES